VAIEHAEGAQQGGDLVIPEVLDLARDAWPMVTAKPGAAPTSLVSTVDPSGTLVCRALDSDIVRPTLS
jgi:hypothetical protein